MRELAPTTSMALPSRPTRQIRFWGSAARLVVGLGALIAAALIGVSRPDVLVGLVALPVVEVAIAAARGINERPLRPDRLPDLFADRPRRSPPGRRRPRMLIIDTTAIHAN